MAISSYNAKLMYKATSQGTYSQLLPIKGIPGIGGTPENLDTTTCDDSAFTYIPGIQTQEQMTVQGNYDSAVYSTIKALEGTEIYLAIYLGNDGEGGDGIFEAQGKVTVSVDQTDINSVVNMTVTITPSTVWTKAS